MRFQIYQTGDVWNWRLLAGNNWTMAQGPSDGFTEKDAAYDSIRRFSGEVRSRPIPVTYA